MGIRVTIELGYEFAVRAGLDEVFGVLADVPDSASHFPRVHRLVDLGGGAFRWEMERTGVSQITHQTVYASRYVADRGAGTVTWTPVPGEGNAEIAGRWRASDRAGHTHLVLEVRGEMQIPLPALMQPVVAPVVRAEFEKLVETYIANLTRRFGGAA